MTKRNKPKKSEDISRTIKIFAKKIWGAKTTKLVRWKIIQVVATFRKNYSIVIIKLKNVGKYTKDRLVWYVQLTEHWIAMNSFLVPRFLDHRKNMLLNKHGMLLLAIAYFMPLGLGIVVINNFVNLTLGSAVARDFFIGSGAMVGGTLAIVVTFALFTVQQAAEQLPKDFYKLATNLKKYLIIFLADVFITLLLFIAALAYGKLGWGLSGHSINVGIFLVGSSFYLILLLLDQVKNDVDKDKILVKAVNSLIETVEQVHSRSVKVAQAQLLHPANRGRVTLDQALARLYQSPSLLLQFEYLKRELDYLFDYHDSFLASNQKRAALEVLEGIRAVVSSYLVARKTSSSAYPEANSLMMLTSDSQSVLQPILERSISLSEDYMKRKDTAGTMTSVNVFIEWAKQASEITFVGIGGQENPTLEQISGYFCQLMDRAIKQESLEGMYQGLRFCKQISNLAVQKSYIHVFSSLVNEVEEIAIQGVISKQDPVISEAFRTYSDTLNTIFNSQSSLFDHYFMLISRHIDNLVWYGYTYTAGGGIRGNMIAQQDVAKPHNTLMELVYRCVAKCSSSDRIEEKGEWQHMTLEIVKDLRISLRSLSEKMKNPNHMLILSFGKIIGRIGTLLVDLADDQEWNGHRSSLLVEAKSYLHLSTFFLHGIDNFESNLSFDSLIEAVTNIGMASLEHDDMDDISGDAINILATKAIEFIDKQKSRGAMYLESDVIEHACYLGIVANKKGKSALVATLKQKIRDFEAKYLQKYYSVLPDGYTAYQISPPADKLRKDIETLCQRRNYGWTDRFGMGMVEDSADKMMSMVNATDIQSFTSIIWSNGS